MSDRTYVHATQLDWNVEKALYQQLVKLSHDDGKPWRVIFRDKLRLRRPVVQFFAHEPSQYTLSHMTLGICSDWYCMPREVAVEVIAPEVEETSQ